MSNVSVVTGDLFDPAKNFDAIGHGVNTYGMMGAGIAVPFKNKHPEMYEEYAYLCKYELLTPGGVFVYEPEEGPVVFNIASQDAPGANAKALWLAQGLYRSLAIMSEIGLYNLGLPWIGCGIGGLTKESAMVAIKQTAARFPDHHVTIVELPDVV